MSRFLLLITVLFCACSKEEPASLEYELSGSTMGTTFSVSVVLPREDVNSGRLEQAIFDALLRIDNSMSTYVPEAELAMFNSSKSTGWVPVSGELCTVIEQALEIARFTNGAFDITVGPLVNLWGFGPEGARRDPPDETELASAHALTGFKKLQADCPNTAIRKSDALLQVDLSAYAKGVAVDKVANVLNQNAIEDYLVEIGGEIRARGKNKSGDYWRIAIEEPRDFERSIQKILSVNNMSVATSGDYRNYFEFEGRRFSHTIDPHTGRPVDHQLAAVTVVDESAARADALATALLVMGPIVGQEFAEQHSIAALFLVHERAAIAEHMTRAFEDLPTP